MDKYVICSGGMDPVHKGHVDYLREASKFGKVIVLLNSDDWLMRKKNYVFMEFDERRYILDSLKYVWRVDHVNDYDGTVCAGIFSIFKELRVEPGDLFFAKGGDRGPDNTPEISICDELGIDIIWNCGGGKVQSSSELVKNVRSC